MLQVNHLSGFGGGASAPVTSVAFQTSADSDAQTITCPTVSAGDIGILLDGAVNGSGIPTNVIPAGFTQLQTSNIDFARTTMSYKVFDGSEDGSSLTGMNGDASNAKVLLIFRPNGVVSSVGLSTFLQETTNGNPASQAIAASGQSAPLIRLASAAVGSNSTPPPFAAGTFDATVTKAGSFSAIRAGYTVQNSAPSDDTVDVGDNGNGNCLMSGWMNFS
jgi:hypothetical protein